MKLGVILYLLGKISLGMGLVQLVPLVMSIYYEEQGTVAFFISIVSAFVISLVLTYAGRNATRKDLSVREGIGTVFFSWVLAAGLASIPFCILGILDPMGAYFESMSGLTTTGATAIADLECLPKSILFWRAMMHWMGGIGIIVIFVAYCRRLKAVRCICSTQK